MLDSYVANPGILHSIGVLAAFIITMVSILIFRKKLPQDQGRAFAVEGEKSRGKVRGAGLIIVCVFAIVSALCSGANSETLLYILFVMLCMVTGYMDDASERPWKDYKKAIYDLVVAIGISVVYIIENGTTVNMALFDVTFTMPVPWFALLSVILIWVSINVANCTDGVDGLSASVGIVTLISFVMLAGLNNINWNLSFVVLNFISCLLGYLMFNISPSTVLMGDAGSRAMGVLVAICALKIGDPFIWILFAFVFMVDGGLGLVKLFLGRFFKIMILKNVRCPIHDHVRKNMGWSNPQTVYRFTVLQGMISVIILWLASR